MNSINKPVALFLGIVLAIVILGVGSYAFLNNPNNIPASAPLTFSELEVDLTNDGFLPQMLVVRKGQMVRFVNRSDMAMQVASSPHPQHTDYPEFDQTKSSSSGQNEYLFTFQRVGTWNYHNHDNPAQRGTIQVVE